MMWCIRPRWSNACAAHSEQTRPGEGLQGTTATGGEGCRATMERHLSRRWSNPRPEPPTPVGEDVSLHGSHVTAPPEAAPLALASSTPRGEGIECGWPDEAAGFQKTLYTLSAESRSGLSQSPRHPHTSVFRGEREREAGPLAGSRTRKSAQSASERVCWLRCGGVLGPGHADAARLATRCLIASSRRGIRCRARSCMLGVRLSCASSCWSASKRRRRAAISPAYSLAGGAWSGGEHCFSGWAVDGWSGSVSEWSSERRECVFSGSFCISFCTAIGSNVRSLFTFLCLLLCLRSPRTAS